MTYASKDGSLRFSYPASWHVIDNRPDYVALENVRESAAEAAARERAGDYTYHDGEAKIEVAISSPLDLTKVRRDVCTVQNTTLRVRECTTIRFSKRQALWALVDESDDADCTCRILVLNGPRYGYRLSGGGCIACAHTPAILRQIEAIFRSLVVS